MITLENDINYLTPKQSAIFSGVSRQAIHLAIQTGLLEYKEVLGEKMLPKKSVIKYRDLRTTQRGKRT